MSLIKSESKEYNVSDKSNNNKASESIVTHTKKPTLNGILIHARNHQSE